MAGQGEIERGLGYRRTLRCQCKEGLCELVKGVSEKEKKEQSRAETREPHDVKVCEAGDREE